MHKISSCTFFNPTKITDPELKYVKLQFWYFIITPQKRQGLNIWKSVCLIFNNNSFNPGCVLKVVDMLSTLKFLKLINCKFEKKVKAKIAVLTSENEFMPVMFIWDLFFPKNVYV